MNALKALRSPLALDLYVWLGYRFSYLKKRTEIPWRILALQFGSQYKRTVDFRVNAEKALKKVLTYYPNARISQGKRGLILRPSKPHIAKLAP